MVTVELHVMLRLYGLFIVSRDYRLALVAYCRTRPHPVKTPSSSTAILSESHVAHVQLFSGMADSDRDHSNEYQDAKLQIGSYH